MKCPYCNEEMERGFIISGHEIVWEPKRRYIGGSILYNDVVVLSEISLASLFKGNAVIAYNCKKCKKVIIDYEINADANKKDET